MGLIRAVAILAIDNRFRTPSLKLKWLETSSGAQKQKFLIPLDSTWPPCDLLSYIGYVKVGLEVLTLSLAMGPVSSYLNATTCFPREEQSLMSWNVVGWKLKGIMTPKIDSKSLGAFEEFSLALSGLTCKFKTRHNFPERVKNPFVTDLILPILLSDACEERLGGC